MNVFWAVYVTGLMVSLVWGFVDWCNRDVPGILHDLARARPALLYLLVTVYFMFWPASIAVIAEAAWKAKRERDKNCD